MGRVSALARYRATDLRVSIRQLPGDKGNTNTQNYLNSMGEEVETYMKCRRISTFKLGLHHEYPLRVSQLVSFFCPLHPSELEICLSVSPLAPRAGNEPGRIDPRGQPRGDDLSGTYCGFEPIRMITICFSEFSMATMAIPSANLGEQSVICLKLVLVLRKACTADNPKLATHLGFWC